MPKSGSSSSESRSDSGSVSEEKTATVQKEQNKSLLPENIKIDLMKHDPNEDLKSHNENEEYSNWYELRLKPNYTDKLPNRRGHHSSFVHDGRLFIFGGNDIKEGTMDCLWMLNLNNISEMEKADKMKSCKWTQIFPTGSGPGKLAYHSSIIVEDTMYLYGGSSQTSEND